MVIEFPNQRMKMRMIVDESYNKRGKRIRTIKESGKVATRIFIIIIFFTVTIIFNFWKHYRATQQNACNN